MTALGDLYLYVDRDGGVELCCSTCAGATVEVEPPMQLDELVAAAEAHRHAVVVDGQTT